MRGIWRLIGPDVDVPAPDVNTNPQIMAWMLDEYEKLVGHQSPATFTGKPIELGGSAGRTEATGQGGVYVLLNLAKKLGLKPETTRIAIQGFGNVGFWFARAAHQKGFKIVAISDSKGAIFNPKGFNPEKVLAHKRESGSVVDYQDSKNITNDKLLTLDVEVLVPAALENAITEPVARKIKARAIIEMANGPVTPQADQTLQKRKIISAPDFLANSGGVTASYFEWVQNRTGDYWPKERVLKRVEKKIVSAFEEVWQISREKAIDLRTATYAVATRRLAQAIKSRGLV